MKSMMLTGIREMELRDVPAPEIRSDTEVLVRVERVGVCGSDVHYYTKGHIGSLVVQYPFTVGHECAGIVEQVGAGVSSVAPGDRIAIDPAISCGVCDQCRAGRANTCRELRFLSCPGQADGALSEYVVVPQESCFPLRDTTPLELGTLSEPLGVLVHACKLAGPLEGAHVGVLGCGPIGLGAILNARINGAETIYATDKIAPRLDAARRMGAHWAGNPGEEDIVVQISSEAPLLLDYIFECCGKQEAIDQALQLLKPGGKLLMIGIPEVDRLSFVVDSMRRDEICLQNVRRQRDCTQQALDLIETGDSGYEAIITHHFPLDEAQQAFDLVAGYEDGVIKAMITLG